MSRSLHWPNKEPGSTRTYALDVGADLTGAIIQQVSASVMPSGNNEMTINGLSVAGSLVEFSLTGGVAGRSYMVRADVTPYGHAAVEYVCWLYIDRVMAAWPVANPINAGFGSATIWIYAPSLDFSKQQNIWMMMR